MVLRIGRDHNRFKEIVKGKIKQDFKKYITKEELIAAIEDVDGVLGSAQLPFPSDVLDRAPRLRTVCNVGVGYDNVDLPHATQRGVLVAKGNEITVNDLPESLRTDSATTTEFVIPPHRTLAEIEKMAILQTLQRTNWNKQEAAQILGLYRPTLYSKMKKHDIQDGSKSAGRRATTA